MEFSGVCHLAYKRSVALDEKTEPFESPTRNKGLKSDMHKLNKLLVCHPWWFVGITLALNFLIMLFPQAELNASEAKLSKQAISMPFLLSTLIWISGLVVGGLLWRCAKKQSQCRWPSRFTLSVMLAIMIFSLVASWGVVIKSENMKNLLLRWDVPTNNEEVIPDLESKLRDPGVSDDIKLRVARLLFSITGKQYTYLMSGGSEVKYELSEKDLEIQGAIQDVDSGIKRLTEAAFFNTAYYVIMLILAWFIVTRLPTPEPNSS